MDSYQLSAVLKGHTADVSLVHISTTNVHNIDPNILYTFQVRALYVQSNETVVSASRDASAIVWEKIEGTHEWQARRSIPDQQGKFVSALAGITIDGRGMWNTLRKVHLNPAYRLSIVILKHTMRSGPRLVLFHCILSI
jgi:hypothetical protein